MNFIKFLIQSLKLVLKGNKSYYAWVSALGVLIVVGALAYMNQVHRGLLVTNMRDQVSWAFYIGNFTFLVGVAAAAITLVIPAYIYHWGPIKEIVILGELLAISAVVMVIMFVSVDIGRPDRLLHMVPLIGSLNFPQSLLSWDVIVLSLYLILNLTIVLYILYKTYMNQELNKEFLYPLILLSIPMAISIHTVTAFIYNGVAARPYWNASILAPRFLASAFCSGPAIMLVLLQILKKTTKLEIKDEAIWKIAELMAYALFVNLFLWGSEIFKEYYSATEHLLYTQYLYTGINGHNAITMFGWAAAICNIVSFLLFLIPSTRKNIVTLNLGCLLVYSGVYIEKGLGLVIPGLTPDSLGEIYEYSPSITELCVAAGIFSTGFLIYTILLKVAVPISLGEFTINSSLEKKK